MTEFDLQSWLRYPKYQKFMNRGTRCGLEAARQAWQSSAIKLGEKDPYRIGVYVGSGQTELESCQFFRALDFASRGTDKLKLDKLGGRASRLIDPYVSLTSLSNAGVFFLSAEFQAQGPSGNFVQGETASAMAVAAAFDDLRENRCDLALAGGFDSLLNASSYLAYQRAGLLCKSCTYRPFDCQCDGLALGEGAGFLILERLGDARQREAPVLGELLGRGFSMDQSDQQSPAAFQQAMQSAIRQATQKRSFECIVARGVGTAQDDLNEAGALRELAGEEMAVTAFKGQTGYLGAATASVELAIALLALKQRLIPPLSGLNPPAAQRYGLNFVADPWPLKGDSPAVLCLSRCWTGQCAAIVAGVVPSGSKPTTAAGL